MEGGVVDGRFELGRIAGRGGMGIVYRALDRTTGEPVAVKVLTGTEPRYAERFAREVRVLADLRHGSIVRYVAHGTSDGGQPYLAMEWLDGEDLASRLLRGRLSFHEAVSLGLSVAHALACAHERGIVHRDVKPSNVFLIGADLSGVKVLDFGVARTTGVSLQQTRPGSTLGTPGYMAPEQARGERSIDARADVFSLGAVLFECITGASAFPGEHVMAILAKILIGEPRRVSAQRPDVPVALDGLIERMLSRKREDRPANAAAVRDELLSLGSLTPSSRPAARSEPPRVLTTREQRVSSIVLVGALPRAQDGATAPTLAIGEVAHPGLHAVASRFDAEAQPLVGGATVIRMSGTARDQAMRAVRCALAAREACPGVPIALASARGDTTSEMPTAGAIDRAARLIDHASRASRRAAASASDESADPARGIRIDAVTASLVDARFEIHANGPAMMLVGERPAVERTRKLLGRPTSCVGRTRELRMLEATWAECIEEPIARAVLVTAPPGVGKSRLRYEFALTVTAQHEEARVWIGRGDPTSAGSPLGSIAQVARMGLGVVDGDPIEERHRKIGLRLARHRDPATARRIAEFLGELVGAPFPDDESVQLRAARADPVLMGDQIRHAFEEWVAHECEIAPLLLVLEDLHWGDWPSVRLVDSVLKSHRDSPLMVLALARPEVSTLFPGLWAERALVEMRLDTLTPRAAQQLVREAIEDVSPTMVDRIVARADGNAFFIEELIRVVAEGRGHDLPDTILAVMQDRLERLEPGARRALRAGSVFGDSFHRDGVSALCGDDAAETDDWLHVLVERELVSRRPSARFRDDEEYVFRHALVRDAAYAMLTENDRQTGHRLAAEWLEASGERDSDVLAQHFERGGENARAVEHYTRAAAEAFKANDLDGSVERCESASVCGPDDAARASLAVVRATVHRWRGDFATSAEAAGVAMRGLDAGSSAWFEGASDAAWAAGKLGRREQLLEVVRIVTETAPARDAVGRKALALSDAAIQLYFAGEYALADELLGSESLAAPGALDDPGVRGVNERARAYQVYFRGDLGAALAGIQAAQQSFEEAGDRRNVCVQLGAAGYVAVALGQNEEAQRALEHALAMAERMGLATPAATAMQNLGLVRARLGVHREGLSIEERALAAFEAHGDRRMCAASHVYRAEILAMCDRLEEADAAATRGIEISIASPPIRVHALASASRIRLRRGEVSSARALAEEAAELLGTVSGIGEGESIVWLALVEARLAAGDRDAAREALSRGAADLRARAERISDPEHRRSFLGRVPENVALLALAEQPAVVQEG